MSNSAMATNSKTSKPKNGRDREVILHSPRKQKTFSKDDLKMLEQQIEEQGFISLWWQPRTYMAKLRNYKPLKGHGMGCRVFSVAALEELIGKLEEVLHG